MAMILHAVREIGHVGSVRATTDFLERDFVGVWWWHRGFPVRNRPRIPSVNTAPLARTHPQKVGLYVLPQHASL